MVNIPEQQSRVLCGTCNSRSSQIGKSMSSSSLKCRDHDGGATDVEVRGGVRTYAIDLLHFERPPKR